jgi:hypothetical protein
LVKRPLSSPVKVKSSVTSPAGPPVAALAPGLAEADAEPAGFAPEAAPELAAAEAAGLAEEEAAAVAGAEL